AGAVGVVLDALASRPRYEGADVDRLDDALRFVDARRGLVRGSDVARDAATSLGEVHRWCAHLLGTTPAPHPPAVRVAAFARESVGPGPVDAATTVAAIEWFVEAGYPPREVERFTGLPPAELRRLGEHLAHRLSSAAGA